MVKQMQTRINGEMQVDQLPVGDYIILTSHRDNYNAVEWLVKFRVEVGQVKQVFLTNSNATFVAR